ncbi:hypothetical protein JCM14469_38120 [Desulfatiferula olefinivorans]
MKNERRKKHKSPWIILALALTGWLAMLPFFSEAFFSGLFFMPFVGAVAAVVANITPAAAGIIYFPILTHLSVSPVTVAQFNLAIQAYGMGLGTFRWFLFNRRLFLFNVLPLSIAGGLLGEIVSMVIYPIRAPEMLTLIFNGIAFVFTQIIFFSLLRNTKYPNNSFTLTASSGTVLFAVAFVGGLLCGWIGFGIDTIFYFMMTMVYRINPAVAIVTSIALMAVMSITGTLFNVFIHNVPFTLFYSALPGVTLGGLFLAAYIAVRMGPRNILLLFTFFLSADFFMTLWTQQTIPMSETIRKLVIYVLVFYLLAIHVRIMRNQSRAVERRGKDQGSYDSTPPASES